MSERFIKYALELLALPTSPGNEGAVARWVERFVARRAALSLRRDAMGNLVIRYGKSRKERRLVFGAHMDHPGFTSLHAEPDGLLTARWNGSVPAELFPGAKVRFFSRGAWVRGVLVSGELRKDRPIPLLVRARMKGPVQPGSVGMWDFPDPRIEGNCLIARGCDDVAGVASLISLLDEAVRRKLPQGFDVLFTRGEEAAFLGAIAAAEAGTIPKTAVIVAVETSKALPSAPLGAGPIVRVGDKTGIFTPAVTAFLADVAGEIEKADPVFRWQRKLMDGGTCESSVYVEYGYEAGGLCIPLGNYHNIAAGGKRLGPEFIDVRDYLGLVRLYVAAVERFDRYGRQGGDFKKWCRENYARQRYELEGRLDIPLND